MELRAREEASNGQRNVVEKCDTAEFGVAREQETPRARCAWFDTRVFGNAARYAQVRHDPLEPAGDHSTDRREPPVIGREGVTTTDVNLRPVANAANTPIGLAESGSKVKVLSC